MEIVSSIQQLPNLCLKDDAKLFPVLARYRNSVLIPQGTYAMCIYSSELRGLCLMKLLSEIPQNLPYFFEYENPQKTFIIFHFMEWGKRQSTTK